MKSSVALLILLVVTSCAGAAQVEGSSERSRAPDVPEASVERLLRALEDGRCERAKDVVLTPSELSCGQVTESMGSLEAEGIDLAEVTYEADEVVNDSATVSISWGNGYPPEQYDVQRVEGEWLVVLDSAA